MSASDWGLTFETHAGDRWNFEDVATNGGTDRLVDGYTTRTIRPQTTGAALRPAFQFADTVPSGSAIACKVCRRRIRDRESTRRGRWYIAHEELTTVDAVALGVYHEEGGIIGAATTVLPVAALEPTLGEFVDAGHPKYDRVTRPSWATVFDPEVVRHG